MTGTPKRFTVQNKFHKKYFLTLHRSVLALIYHFTNNISACEKLSQLNHTKQTGPVYFDMSWFTRGLSGSGH